MTVLFITRKYPPQTGGMEKYSYQLVKHFPGDKRLIALRRTSGHLIWFLPYALIKSLFLIRQVDLVYLTDGLLAPLGLIIKWLSGKPVVATAHGLDVTYQNWLYQKLNVGALKYLDKIVAVSHPTIDECVKRGVDRNKCVFIPNGINVSEGGKKYSRLDLAKFIGAETEGKRFLLTVGRLVKRKGVAWFIDKVMPGLSEDVIYLVVGAGPEKNAIQEVVRKNRLQDRVLLLGRISDADLELVYQTADLFVMPNVKVAGDMEGFGIVAIEAASHGLSVVASRIEGIVDAVIDGKNGFLVEAKNTTRYTETIQNILSTSRNLEMATKVQVYTRDRFSWNQLGKIYSAELNNLKK